ncbi:MAG: fibronectin type III domain-containing protein, partial [Ginsengibacter sp.]
MNRLTTGFDTLGDGAFQTKAESICNAMTGNSNFPVTTPPIADVSDALSSYVTAFMAAQFRDKNAVAIKNQSRETLTLLLIQLANSVMTIANGDKAMLVSSGFDLARDPATTPITKPETVILTDGVNAGELVLKVPSVKGARGYVPQYTMDPLTETSEWTRVVTTSSKYTFRNLVPAKKYWCRVAAVGPYNQVVFSDAVSRVVQ